MYLDLVSRSNLCVVQIHKKLRLNPASQPSGTPSTGFSIFVMCIFAQKVVDLFVKNCGRIFISNL